MNRKTTQHLIPIKEENDAQDSYRIYPSFKISKEKIHLGYNTLAKNLVNQKTILLDGYIGVDWNEIQHELC